MIRLLDQKRPLLGWVLVLFLSCTSSGFIASEEAKAKVQKGALLVDVRTPEEFAEGHIKGAINLPVDELEQRKSELKPDAEIVLYCRSGARSGRAKSMLERSGYQRVYNLGGMSNW